MNPTMTNIFPAVVDSTMLSAYGSCPTYFKYGYVDNWKANSETKSIHLHAGGCFAKGLEEGRRAFYIDGLPEPAAEKVGLEALEEAWGDYEPMFDTPKTLDRMLGALEFYYSNYPLAFDHAQVADLAGRKAVEFSFAIPLPVLHPTSGEPIIFSGRCDAAVNYANGLYAMDEKTTSSLGASWANQWALRGQFSGYAWALREIGYKPAGTIVRGVSILKTKYETQEVVVPQPDWKIDRWYREMTSRLQRMVADYQRGEWALDLGESCNHYGSCTFKQVCMAPDPKPWLEGYFKQEIWNPLERH